MMEWIFEPTAWVGLLTLVVLEIVLGIDNLIFIAILADKLPPAQRDRARIIGLSLALVMRLGLLTVISWLVTLTRPLITLGDYSFSGRDLILILGGFFLLFKATVELHARLEGPAHPSTGPRVYAGFWVVVAQIVVLDAVFSLDAVITAVGMVEHLAVMMLAVIISIGVMLVASKPLTRFVNAHPTVVVLCLSFLLMIGLSLVAEGMGLQVPKGYVYAAIGFSILVEFFNQLARAKMVRAYAARPLRARTAEAVMGLLGAKPQAVEPDQPANPEAEPETRVFAVEERNMVSGVLSLAERSVHSIMTPRNDISWIDLDDDPATIRRQLTDIPHSLFPVCRGNLDEVVGFGRSRDLLADILLENRIRPDSLREPLIVHESISMLHLMDTLKQSRGQLVLITDEFGAIEGLVTPIDLFEAIAGEFPDEDELPDILAEGDKRWRVAGAADLHHLEQVLGISGLVSEDYATLAGYLLAQFDKLPAVGQIHDTPDGSLRFEVLEVTGRRIVAVRITRQSAEPEAAAE